MAGAARGDVGGEGESSSASTSVRGWAADAPAAGARATASRATKTAFFPPFASAFDTEVGSPRALSCAFSSGIVSLSGPTDSRVARKFAARSRRSAVFCRRCAPAAVACCAAVGLFGLPGPATTVLGG